MKYRCYDKQRNFCGLGTQKLVESIETQNKAIEKAVKNVADRLYTPSQLQPIIDCTVPKFIQKGSLVDSSTPDKRFTVRAGNSIALNHCEFKKNL